MKWTPRTVTDQQVQYPHRYEMREIDTGLVLGTYDLQPVRVDGDIEGTPIDAAWLQPIEDFLGQIQNDLNALGAEIVEVDNRTAAAVADTNGRVAAAEGRLNGSIANVNSRIDAVNTAVTTLAPKSNPVLTNPAANTIAITANSTALATTAAVKTYLDALMAGYRG